jgi:hypothetical protein
MPLPLIAAAAARIIPMVASSAGRAAASGAARMGASEGLASKVGQLGEGATTRMLGNAISTRGGNNGTNNEPRLQNFYGGGGNSAPSGGEFDTYNPVT